MPRADDDREAQALFSQWLEVLGFHGDPQMERTAARVSTMMREFLPRAELPAVSTFPVECPGPVVVRALPFHSMCAHHLLPFFGDAAIAYLPADSVLGFSGIAQVVDHFARRPQLQERMSRQVLDALWDTVSPRALVVQTTARHLCMEMRGARSPGEIEVIAERGACASELRSLLAGT